MPSSAIDTTIGAVGLSTPKSSQMIGVEPITSPTPGSAIVASITKVVSLVVPHHSELADGIDRHRVTCFERFGVKQHRLGENKCGCGEV